MIRTSINMSSSDICIIGNGVIAKTAAIALAQFHFRVILLTPIIQNNTLKFIKPIHQDLRVYAINQIAQTLLTTIHVWNLLEIKQCITPVNSIEITGDSQCYPGKLIFDAYTARVTALAWIIENQQLMTALDTILKFESNIRVINSYTTNIQICSEHINLQLQNGDVLKTALLIGADGAKSWVRKQCNIGLDYHSYDQQTIVTNFICEKPHQYIAYQWFTSNDGILAILPLSNQRISVIWSMPDTLAQSLLYQPITQLIQHLKKYIKTKFGILTPVTSDIINSFPLMLIQPHTIIAERVVLIGDAAHTIHPLAGHGMNLGFADIMILTKILNANKYRNDCGNSNILKHYERVRKKEVLLMQFMTYGLTQLFKNQSIPLCFIRNLGLNLINHSSILKRYLVTHAIGAYIH